TKILTIEASGIGIACIAAQYFNVPVVFAKKNQTKNIAGDVYTSKVESFTHGRVYDIIVSKDFLKPEDKVLVIDDFLANGAALIGLINLIKDAKATLVGAGIVIEVESWCAKAESEWSHWLLSNLWVKKQELYFVINRSCNSGNYKEKKCTRRALHITRRRT
ncbi:MAG: xanthine phosphoribosyltransferase, partial [Firmicutes bacterium]|nr:xanthine phosphoribosyltransferase [Bacillota bacterium]